MKQWLFRWFLLLTFFSIKLSVSGNVGETFVDDNLHFVITSEEEKTVELSSTNRFEKGKLTIPSFIIHNGKSYNVTSIGKKAFQNCILHGVKIPDTIERIGAWAFQRQPLATIDLGNNLKIIEQCAFSNNVYLKSLVIPNSVTNIGKDAFSDNISLETVSLGESLEIIDDGAFENCTKLTSIKMPNSIKTIGIRTFEGCKGLTNLKLSESLTEIPAYCFKNCTHLSSIIIPNSVTKVGREAFYECIYAKQLILGKSIRTIEDEAFCHTSSINGLVEMPPSLESMGCLSLANCGAKGYIFTSSNPPSFDSDCFTNTWSRTYLLYVPNQHLQVYLDYWYSIRPKSYSPVYTATVGGKKGYFNYIDFGCIIAYNDINELIGEKEQTSEMQYALTYKVDDEIYKTYKLKEGEKITPEPEPNKEGYIFSGWSEIPSTMPAYDFTVNGYFTKSESKLDDKEWVIIDDDFDKSTPFTKIRVLNKKSRVGNYCCIAFSTSPNTNIGTDKFYINFWTLTIGDNSLSSVSWGKSITSFTYVGDNWYEYEFSCPIYFAYYQDNCPRGQVKVLIQNEENETSSTNTEIVTGLCKNYSQPPIVGGVLKDFVENTIIEKGVIISSNSNNLVYDTNKKENIFSFWEYKDFKVIDCTSLGKEQFWCTLGHLKPNKDYYVKAYAIRSDGSIIYGQTEKIHTQDFNRYSGKTDYANVWYAFKNTLFDLVTDEIINLDNGFYYSTNERPKTVKYQKGTSYNTCYKFKTEWNYKLWYYHSIHCVQNKKVNVPIITFKYNKLTIERNPLDADKSITIFYSINGDYFRPENYADVYINPIEINKPCTVYCYAISSDGYMSYTNMYIVGEVENDEGNNKVADFVDLGLSSKTLWATCNIGASSPEEYGDLFAWGELMPKTNYSTSTYKFYNGNYTKYGSIDRKYRLDSDDDVAYQVWGKNWRIPTFDELKELVEECTFIKTEINGVPVTKAIGPNGNYIYFPFSGNYTGATLYYKNSVGSYWSSDLKSDSYAKDIDFNQGKPSLNGDSRYHGQAIRAVYVGGTSDINEITDTNFEEDRYYNLQGQRVLYPKNGIFIKNGKIIFIK